MNPEFNLYGERPTIPNEPLNNTTRPILIDVDLSKPNTLLEMINSVRYELESRSIEQELTIYFVCGRELKCQDVNLFIDYLQTLENPLSIAVRGYVHFDFIKLLFSFPVIKVASNLKLIYSKAKLHDGLQQMMNNKDIMQKFMQLFISTYHKLEEGTLLDITDMSSFGIKLEQL